MAVCLRSIALSVLDDALAIVRDRRGIDFSGYRRGTLERRLAAAIAAAGVGDRGRYLDLLRVNDAEIERLITHFTVKFTRFYRNAPVFDALRARILPELAETFGGEPLRIWSAGCARGEEAYTLAMVLGDAAGEVLGTDVDPCALAAGRAARYPLRALEELPLELLTSFTAVDGPHRAFAVRDEVRRRVRFAPHDLLGPAAAPPAGAPFHLICCRNVLIYFEPALQRRAMRLLIGALAPGGVLCAGEAEWVPEFDKELEALDAKKRLFRRPLAVGGAA